MKTMSVDINKNGCSYTDYLCKKEAKGKWVHYWVVLDGKHLNFYETNQCENLIGRVEIGGKSKCVVSKRKEYSFPFTLCAAHGRYLLKCETAVRRHRWMKEIHQAAELLRLPVPGNHVEDDLRISAFENKAMENNEDDENNRNILPSNVLLVAPLPSARDSPTIPFKLRNRERKTSNESAEGEDGKISPKQESIVYSFDRESEQLVPRVSDLERKQFSSLHIHSPFRTDLLSDSLDSPRARSFPTTPEKGVRPTSSPSLHGSPYLGMSRSLNSLMSSRTDMRFSRHMVSGSDIGDTEV